MKNEVNEEIETWSVAKNKDKPKELLLIHESLKIILKIQLSKSFE